MKKLLPALISLIFLTVSSQAATITVNNSASADYKDIQSALNAAIAGDTIIVSNGTYTGPLNRMLNFKGKAVTLRSENGPENCIIDCRQQNRAFYFSSGESNDAVIDGFTITNGSETYGGAVYCDNYSSPTITNCIIRDNYANSYGGGVYCINYSSPVITNCIFRNNQTGSYGGGMYNAQYAASVITNCTFQDNYADTYGGGIFCRDFGSLYISDCTIHNNHAGSYGGGIHNRDDGLITVVNSTISDNTGSYGGGIYTYNGTTATLTNCVLTRNSATTYYGGGMRVYSSILTITNCTFDKNETPESGGALYINGESSIIISNSIFSNCSRYGIYISSSSVNKVIESCLFYENSVADLYDSSEGSFTGKDQLLTHPNVDGASDGNPDYAFENDYHLTRNSEARDVGNDNPKGGLPETDKDGNPRILFGGRGRVPRVDVGAYEFNKDVPAIAVSTENLEFVRGTGAPNPESQILQIRNTANSKLRRRNFELDYRRELPLAFS